MSVHRVTLLVLCALLAACIPESKNPLSPPNGAAADPRLEGVWAMTKDGETAYVHIHRRNEKGHSLVSTSGGEWTDITLVSHEKTSGIEVAHFTMFPTRLGRSAFMNLRGIEDGKVSKTYTLARYEVTWLGKLKIWLMSESLAADAVRSGKLRGKVKRGTDVEITDTTERLAAFVASADHAKLFPDLYDEYRRIAKE